MILREVIIYLTVYIGLVTLSYYALSLFSKKSEEIEIPLEKLPFVSIIIPAYNEQETILQTIKSAYNLDYPKNKFEIIVVDDGSKDRTYKTAKLFKSSMLKVFTKENGGKASALNLGIKHAKGEIIVTMDADTFIASDALKKMINHFSNKDIVCVSPSPTVYKPRGILQRLQQVEYFLGVFLRKAFASMNAIHITPGAFSAYRKKFFDKHGLFEVGNLTEDLEMALRIQANHYRIQYVPDAVLYTHSPNTFFSLLKQRRRWYAGLIKNLWKYRRLFSREYGELGTIVLPTAVITIILSVILTAWFLLDSLLRLNKELLLLKSINFGFSNFLNFNKFFFEKTYINFFGHPYAVFFLLFIGLTIGYLIFAKKNIKKDIPVAFSFPIYLVLYAVLFSFWWIISIFYVLLNRRVTWE